tara:strand:- start:2043 stop:2336 length:294 start_codon:yes stop_codon:yes gene_type:complete
MNSLICRSGFGLYGYLPAIYKLTNKIYLNRKYQKINKFFNPFLSKINSKSIDTRCFFLEKYIRKNLFDYNNNSSNDLSFLNLWNKIESNSKNVKKFS